MLGLLTRRVNKNHTNIFQCSIPSRKSAAAIVSGFPLRDGRPGGTAYLGDILLTEIGVAPCCAQPLPELASYCCCHF